LRKQQHEYTFIFSVDVLGKPMCWRTCAEHFFFFLRLKGMVHQKENTK